MRHLPLQELPAQAGSALSIIVGVPEGSVSIEGEVKTYNDTGDSGATVKRQFCGSCGSPSLPWLSIRLV